jgi:hypothetical protein
LSRGIQDSGGVMNLNELEICTSCVHKFIIHIKDGNMTKQCKCGVFTVLPAGTREVKVK